MIIPRNPRIPDAIYGDPQLEEYRNNPFIACLPPLYSEKKVVELLRAKPHFDPQERFLAGRVRAHAICRLLNNFFQPLNHHLQLEEKISLMIRTGYLGRNLGTGDYHAHLQNGYQRVMKGDLEAFAFEDVHSTATSFSLFGCSGCGKSRALERILSMYPQAINHPDHNVVQLTHLKIDCPGDGDLIALCISFFHAIDRVLGTQYSKSHGRKKLREHVLLANMAQIANLHALGVLIIDEIQNLSEAKSGGAEKMHNFFVNLTNTIGVPVIQVGTHKARKFFQRTFRTARRISGIGNLQWDRLPFDEQWGKFLKTLWKYQWLQSAQPLNAELERTIHDLTQGVIDIVIKLFVLCQMRAIVTGAETITPALAEQVYKDELKPVHPMLSALRSGNAELIKKYDDLVLPNVEGRMLAMTASIEATLPDADDLPPIPSDDKSKRLLSILEQMEVPLDVGLPMVQNILAKFPDLPITALIHKITEYSLVEKPKRSKPVRVKRTDWVTLPHDDLRRIYADSDKDDVYAEFKRNGLIFDLNGLLRTTA